MSRAGSWAPSGLLRAVLTLLLAAVAWAPGAAVGLGVPWAHDLRTQHHPWRAWGAAEWAAGHVPLWCAGAGAGYPLLADGQAGLLYPPTMLLFVLLPDSLALSWTILLHTAWAGVGTFLLARSLGRSEAAALLAAVAFAFGGFRVAHTHYLGMLAALSWIPFVLWAVVRATDERARGRAWAIAALGLWMVTVAGHVQVAAYGWILAGIVTVWRLSGGTRRRRWAPLGGFALAGLLAAALSAPQLAATWELVQGSLREGGVDATFSGMGSLPPQEIVHAILPGFFGFERPADVLQTYHHRGTGYWGAGANHWEMSFYLGIPVAILAAWGIRRNRFWAAVAGVSLLLMLGRHTPLWAWVRHVPGLGYFRFPARFALWFSLAAALLAAGGLDAVLDTLRERPETVRRRARGLLVGIAVLVAVAGGLRASLEIGEPWIRETLTHRFEGQDPAVVSPKVDRIVNGLAADTAPWSPLVLWPVGVAGLLAVGLGLAARRRMAPGLLATGITALLGVDLYAFGGTYHPLVPRSEMSAPPAALDVIEGDPSTFRVTVLDRRGNADLDSELMSASLGLLWGLQDVLVPTPLRLEPNERLLALAGLDVETERGRASLAFLAHLPLASLLGVRYVLTTHAVDDPRLECLQEDPVRVYRNREALPLATLVGCARPVSGPEAALDALATLDPTREALVEADAGALPASLRACEGIPPGRAHLLEHREDAWRIRTESTGPALLVVSETAWPGWQATVDDLPTPLLVADLALKALVVPAGVHEVALVYRPAWLRPALVLAVVALAGLVGLLIRPSGRRRVSGLDPSHAPVAQSG
ncbi:MAG: YfhO family protein [Deltaproteobacteria bacterium]|nr:YfhO family protein [Deltaproteobacteria bacterium]